MKFSEIGLRTTHCPRAPCRRARGGSAWCEGRSRDPGMERSRAPRRTERGRASARPRFRAGLLLRLLGDLAALLGAVGRRHLHDALALAPVLARARVLGGGAAALPLTGVDAGAVRHVAALLPLVRARPESARHDEARRRARDQYPLVHSHSLLLGCRVTHRSGCPSAANGARRSCLRRRVPIWISPRRRARTRRPRDRYQRRGPVSLPERRHRTSW